MNNWRTRMVDRQRWMVFVLPLLVYMVAGSLEPTPDEPGGKAIGLSIAYAWYPWMYAAKIALTVAVIALVWPGYRQFPRRVTLLALLVGLLGGVLWIGLCELDLEHRFLFPMLKHIGLDSLVPSGQRPAFNPFDPKLAIAPAGAWCFMAIRFFGLAVFVPLVEEFFLRGFAMRFVMERDWWNVPFGTASRAAIVVGTALPMLSHPGEPAATAVWFSLITWLMLRTRTIWDCVAAHAITNLMLGIYVVSHGGSAWRLL